jgi:hypothetical protein
MAARLHRCLVVAQCTLRDRHRIPVLSPDYKLFSEPDAHCGRLALFKLGSSVFWRHSVRCVRAHLLLQAPNLSGSSTQSEGRRDPRRHGPMTETRSWNARDSASSTASSKGHR